MNCCCCCPMVSSSSAFDDRRRRRRRISLTLKIRFLLFAVVVLLRIGDETNFVQTSSFFASSFKARCLARVERRTLRFEKVGGRRRRKPRGRKNSTTTDENSKRRRRHVLSRTLHYSLSSVYRQSFSDDRCRGLSLCLLSKRAFRDSIQVRREEDGLFPKDTMLRTRTKSNTNDDTIRGGESGSALRGSKGKHHSQRKKKHILNLCIGFAIVFILGAFFSLFVYDIEDLEEASAVSFRDDGKGTLDDESRKKKRRRNHEEKEKETEEAHSTRRRGSQVGSAVTPNARFDVRSSFAQSFAALSKGGNGGSFPYRYVFDLLLFARLCRVFQ